jgi:hypothetical protein
VTDVSREPTHQEIQELLGVYALDAVDAETAAMVERHLVDCVRCSVEVAQHHEVAGLLANSGGASPAGLWSGIARQLDGTSPPSWERLARRLGPDPDRVTPVVEGGEGAAAGASPTDDGPESGPAAVIAIDRGRQKGSVALRAAVIVATAAAVLAVVFGVQDDHLHHQVNALQSPSALTGAEQAAIRSPSSKQVVLRPPSSTGTTGAHAVTVVLTRSGTGFVEAGPLSALPRSETYQLWGIIGGRTISLGLMGRDPKVVPFSVAGDQPVAAFAITAERAGGVVQSSHQPVVTGEVTA